MAEAPALPYRRDALPEYTTYKDEGCHVHPSCLDCPLARCIFDNDVRGDHRRDMQRIAREMAALFDRGVSTSALAVRFKVSDRSVFRYLVLAERQGVTIRRRRSVLVTA